MKFLTIGIYTEAYNALPQAEKDRLYATSVKHILDLKKKYGDQFQFFLTPGWNKQFSIGEYATVEEYYRSLQSPIAVAGYYTCESYALMEADETMLQAVAESLKATQK